MLQKIKNELAEAPEGELQIFNDRGSVRYRYVCNGKRLYLGGDCNQLKKSLALKKLNQYLMANLTKELKAENYFLSHCVKKDFSYSGFKKDFPDFAEILEEKPIFMAQAAKAWADADYISEVGHKEELIYKTQKGHRVRSKSELICL